MTRDGRLGRVSALALSGALVLVASCVTTQSSSNERDRWEVQILRGAQHIGTMPMTDWPPPLGECVDATFQVTDLPGDPTTRMTAAEVLLAFEHAGESRGSIEINGEQIFARVTAVDRFASAIASAIVEVTVCAIESALPGDPDCDPIQVPVETTFVTRRFSTDLLAIGSNSARVCATDGDFLLADGLRLTEAPPSDPDAGGGGDSASDASPSRDAGADAAF